MQLSEFYRQSDLIWNTQGQLHTCIQILSLPNITSVHLITLTPTVSVLQVFDFQHGFLFGKMHRLQVFAMHSMIAPLLDLCFWGSARAPVLQVTQGSRHCQRHHTNWEPTHWNQRGTQNSKLINYSRVFLNTTLKMDQFWCLMPHLTFINSAEEDIEEYTDKQRTQGHLPSGGYKSTWHWKLQYEYGFLLSRPKTFTSATSQLGHKQTHIHTRAGSGPAPRHPQLVLGTMPFSYRTQPCWGGQSAG